MERDIWTTTKESQRIRKPNRDWNIDINEPDNDRSQGRNALENPIGIETWYIVCSMDSIYQSQRIRKPNRDWNMTKTQEMNETIEVATH